MKNISKISAPFSRFSGYPFPPGEDFKGLARRVESPAFEQYETQPNISNTVLMLRGSVVFPTEKQSYRLHRHSRYEMILPREEYHFLLNHQELTLHEDEAVILQPGDFHEDHLVPGKDYYAFEFTCLRNDLHMQTPRIFIDGIQPSQQIVKVRHWEEISDLLRLYWKDVQEQHGGYFPILNALFQAIFWRVSSSYSPKLMDFSSSQNADDEHLRQRVLGVFRNNLRGMPEMATLGQHLGMSVSTLRRACQRLFKMSPAKAFMNYKINCIRQEMTNHPDKSVKQLSREMGFADQFHFSRCFKQIQGVSPKKYLMHLKAETGM